LASCLTPLLKSPEISIPPLSKPWSVTLKMDQGQFTNNIRTFVTYTP
jgi:hypothetical protein